jgi:hypothetical protein
MRIWGVVLGVLLVLVGAVWAGQGLGYVRGSFMTGVMAWFWIGLACVAAGAVLVWLGARRRKPLP